MATPLCEIMERRGSDKGSVVNQWCHTYTPVYHKLFGTIRDKHIRVFELGIGSIDPNVKSNMGANGKPGASLRGWEEYFPNGLIFGGDIDEKTLFETKRIKTFCIDQLSPSSIRKVIDHQEPFDIIIEDGLHTLESNVCFFENTIDKLSSDGIYVIEDIITSLLPKWVNQLKHWRIKYPSLVFSMQQLPKLNSTDNNLLVISRNRVLPPTIALIGHGWLPIPPHGLGAVESLIWEEYNELKKTYNVHIINTQNIPEIIKSVSLLFPDIVHLHREQYFHILDHIDAPVKYVTTHGPDLAMSRDIRFIQGNFIAICLSDVTKAAYLNAGRSPETTIVVPNSITPDLYRFSDICELPTRSIYLGKIEARKRQYEYRNIQSIDFIGPGTFDHPNYLGEWSKQQVHSDLTKYANLVLLSAAECHSCAVIESLMCGLGVVVSQAAAAHLDKKPWITIIPNEKLNDIPYVEQALSENRKIAIAHRREIREYAISKFSVQTRVKELYDKAL